MKLLALNCNRCGAPLEVPQNAKSLTCTFCGTQLSVQRSEGTAYTEAIEEMGERTDKLVEDVEILKLQGELERLDREWTEEREKYMVRTNEGVMVVPSRSQAQTGKILVVVFGSIFTLLGLGAAISVMTVGGAIGGWAVGGVIGLLFMVAPLFGVGFIILGVVMTNRHAKKADEFDDAREAYKRERRALTARLDGNDG